MHFILASAALSKLALSFDNMIQLDSVGFSWIQLWPECHVGGASCKVVLSACQRGVSQLNATPSTSESNNLGQVKL